MRLIGSKEGLPTPGNSNEVNTSFNVQELREYYVPDKKVIFRFDLFYLILFISFHATISFYLFYFWSCLF